MFAVIAFFAIVSWNALHGTSGNVIRSDVHGYYGYLHAIFIGHDLGQEKPMVEYIHETPHGTLNKYFAGEAVLLLPFFLVAHAYVQWAGIPGDGYAPPYETAIAVAALVYCLLGLLALRAVLLRSGVRDGTAALVLLVLGLGTQLAQYTAVQPGWTHVYSFCLFAVFLLLSQRIAATGSACTMVAWGAVLGLIILVRPVNGLVLVALPVLLGHGTLAFIRRFLARRAILVLAALAGFAVMAVQPVLWYAQIGSWWAYGYKGEGFYWDNPAVFQVLFGIRRGLFLWTPVLIAAAVGVLYLWRTDRLRSMAAMLYWAATTYVISSWWIWYYGSGFGARVYVEHYTVLFLPLAWMLDRLGKGWRTALVLFLGAATALHLAQFWQYNHGLLDHEGMDRQKYTHSFLRFGEEYRESLGGKYVTPPYSPHGLDTLVHARWDAEGHVPYWRGRRVLFDPAYSGWHVVACDSNDVYGPSFEMPAKDLPVGRALYLALGFERYVYQRNDTRDVLVVVSTEDRDGVIGQYESFRMEPLPPARDSAWDHIEYRVMLQPLQPNSQVKFFFWNRSGNGRFMADDLDMTVMAARPY